MATVNTCIKFREVCTCVSYDIGQLYALSCLSVLSATLVYCGQTVGWIKMPLGTLELER